MNREEFANLALSCLQEVTAFAHHLTDTRWEADDLIQATYERAFRGWRSLEEPRRCRAWLFQIARNLRVDHLRSARARPELRLVRPDDALAPEATISAREVERLDARMLNEALEEISRAQREAILLCDLWGFTYQEIAEITDAPVGTIRSRIARGRAALCQILTVMEADSSGRGSRGGKER